MIQNSGTIRRFHNGKYILRFILKESHKGILKRVAKSIKLKIGNQCRKSLKPKDSSLKGPIKLISLWPG